MAQAAYGRALVFDCHGGRTASKARRACERTRQSRPSPALLPTRQPNWRRFGPSYGSGEAWTSASAVVVWWNAGCLAGRRWPARPTWGQYLARLRRDKSEIEALIGHLTIKVSRFCRDAYVFAKLAELVLPERARCRRGAALSLWSAGCGWGEEAYSLALLLRRAGLAGSVLGTDVHEGALAVARAGLYRPAALAELPAEQVAEYFALQAGRHGPSYLLEPAVRELVRFQAHDLTAAGPPGRDFDLVLCRNVLIYFDLPTQQRVESLLAASLAPGGFLCLGEAEWLGEPPLSAFAVADRQARLFRKAS